MKDKAGMMATPTYASEQSTYIFPGTDWQGYEQEGTRAGENLKRGYEPLETFPAKWHNTVMNRFSIALQQAKVALDSLYDEMNSILRAAQIEPSAGQVNQILLAIQKLTELHIASATTLGGVLSNPSEAWGVEVDQSTGKMTTKTQLATAQDAGLVKSSATGVDPNRTYNVEVKQDGTMKVCVPWTDTPTPTPTLSYNSLVLSLGSQSVKIPSPIIGGFHAFGGMFAKFDLSATTVTPPEGYRNPADAQIWRLPFACILYVWYATGIGGANFRWGVQFQDDNAKDGWNMPCSVNSGSLSTIIIPARVSFCFGYLNALDNIFHVLRPNTGLGVVGRAYIMRLSEDA